MGYVSSLECFGNDALEWFFFSNMSILGYLSFVGGSFALFFHFHQLLTTWGKISNFDVYIKGKVDMYTMSWDFLYTSCGEDCWKQP